MGRLHAAHTWGKATRRRSRAMADPFVPRTAEDVGIGAPSAHRLKQDQLVDAVIGRPETEAARRVSEFVKGAVPPGWLEDVQKKLSPVERQRLRLDAHVIDRPEDEFLLGAWFELAFEHYRHDGSLVKVLAMAPPTGPLAPSGTWDPRLTNGVFNVVLGTYVPLVNGAEDPRLSAPPGRITRHSPGKGSDADMA